MSKDTVDDENISNEVDTQLLNDANFLDELLNLGTNTNNHSPDQKNTKHVQRNKRKLQNYEEVEEDKFYTEQRRIQEEDEAKYKKKLEEKNTTKWSAPPLYTNHTLYSIISYVFWYGGENCLSDGELTYLVKFLDVPVASQVLVMKFLLRKRRMLAFNELVSSYGNWIKSIEAAEILEDFLQEKTEQKQQQRHNDDDDAADDHDQQHQNSNSSSPTIQEQQLQQDEILRNLNAETVTQKYVDECVRGDLLNVWNADRLMSEILRIRHFSNNNDNNNNSCAREEMFQLHGFISEICTIAVLRNIIFSSGIEKRIQNEQKQQQQQQQQQERQNYGNNNNRKNTSRQVKSKNQVFSSSQNLGNEHADDDFFLLSQKQKQQSLTQQLPSLYHAKELTAAFVTKLSKHALVATLCDHFELAHESGMWQQIVGNVYYISDNFRSAVSGVSEVFQMICGDTLSDTLVDTAVRCMKQPMPQRQQPQQHAAASNNNDDDEGDEGFFLTHQRNNAKNPIQQEDANEQRLKFTKEKKRKEIEEKSGVKKNQNQSQTQTQNNMMMMPSSFSSAARSRNYDIDKNEKNKHLVNGDEDEDSVLFLENTNDKNESISDNNRRRQQQQQQPNQKKLKSLDTISATNASFFSSRFGGSSSLVNSSTDSAMLTIPVEVLLTNLLASRREGTVLGVSSSSSSQDDAITSHPTAFFTAEMPLIPHCQDFFSFLLLSSTSTTTTATKDEFSNAENDPAIVVDHSSLQQQQRRDNNNNNNINLHDSNNRMIRQMPPAQVYLWSNPLFGALCREAQNLNATLFEFLENPVGAAAKLFPFFAVDLVTFEQKEAEQEQRVKNFLREAGNLAVSRIKKCEELQNKIILTNNQRKFLQASHFSSHNNNNNNDDDTNNNHHLESTGEEEQMSSCDNRHHDEAIALETLLLSLYPQDHAEIEAFWEEGIENRKRSRREPPTNSRQQQQKNKNNNGGDDDDDDDGEFDLHSDEKSEDFFYYFPPNGLNADPPFFDHPSKRQFGTGTRISHLVQFLPQYQWLCVLVQLVPLFEKRRLYHDAVYVLDFLLGRNGIISIATATTSPTPTSTSNHQKNEISAIDTSFWLKQALTASSSSSSLLNNLPSRIRSRQPDEKNDGQGKKMQNMKANAQALHQRNSHAISFVPSRKFAFFPRKRGEWHHRLLTDLCHLNRDYDALIYGECLLGFVQPTRKIFDLIPHQNNNNFEGSGSKINQKHSGALFGSNLGDNGIPKGVTHGDREYISAETLKARRSAAFRFPFGLNQELRWMRGFDLLSIEKTFKKLCSSQNKKFATGAKKDNINKDWLLSNRLRQPPTIFIECSRDELTLFDLRIQKFSFSNNVATATTENDNINHNINGLPAAGANFQKTSNSWDSGHRVEIAAMIHYQKHLLPPIPFFDPRPNHDDCNDDDSLQDNHDNNNKNIFSGRIVKAKNQLLPQLINLKKESALNVQKLRFWFHNVEENNKYAYECPSRENKKSKGNSENLNTTTRKKTGCWKGSHVEGGWIYVLFSAVFEEALTAPFGSWKGVLTKPSSSNNNNDDHHEGLSNQTNAIHASDENDDEVIPLNQQIANTSDKEDYATTPTASSPSLSFFLCDKTTLLTPYEVRPRDSREPCGLFYRRRKFLIDSALDKVSKMTPFELGDFINGWLIRRREKMSSATFGNDNNNKDSIEKAIAEKKKKNRAMLLEKTKKQKEEKETFMKNKKERDIAMMQKRKEQLANGSLLFAASNNNNNNKVDESDDAKQEESSTEAENGNVDNDRNDDEDNAEISNDNDQLHERQLPLNTTPTKKRKILHPAVKIVENLPNTKMICDLLKALAQQNHIDGIDLRFGGFPDLVLWYEDHNDDDSISSSSGCDENKKVDNDKIKNNNNNDVPPPPSALTGGSSLFDVMKKREAQQQERGNFNNNNNNSHNNHKNVNMILDCKQHRVVFVEVKSPSDTLSNKQRIVNDLLMSLGFCVHVCRVNDVAK